MEWEVATPLSGRAMSQGLDNMMVISTRCVKELVEQASALVSEAMVSSMMLLDQAHTRVLTGMEVQLIKWEVDIKGRVDLTTQDLERTTAPSIPSVRERQE